MHGLPGVVPLYTAPEIRTLDRLAVEELGIPGVVLMERAGMGAAAEILTWFASSYRVAVICGAGHNGGDGFVVARHLAAAGRSVEILLVESASRIRRESKTNLEIARKLGLSVRRVNATGWRETLASGFDLVVDAMLGTGITSAPRPTVVAAMQAIVECGLPVVSLDMPSGVDASTGSVATTAVHADLTLTFHGPKIGLAVAPGRFHAGRVKVVDIGIPAVLEEATVAGLVTDGLLQAVPARARNANKYTAGRVVCVGGSIGMSGAIALSSQAAMRGGAGVVMAAVPEPLALALDIAIPEVQFRGMIADSDGRITVAAAERLEGLVSDTDAVVFGPGLGDSDQTRALARWAAKSVMALVLDAQGLTAFAGDLKALASRDGAETLLTPHEGELARLLDISSEDVRANRLACAREAAATSRATILLKGEDTIVCEPSGRFLVARGHVAQATAGSGDVLAGVAGALLARGLPALVAGACAALACGRAAELAADELAREGVIASDLLEWIPSALAFDMGGGS